MNLSITRSPLQSLQLAITSSVKYSSGAQYFLCVDFVVDFVSACDILQSPPSLQVLRDHNIYPTTFIIVKSDLDFLVFFTQTRLCLSCNNISNDFCSFLFFIFVEINDRACCILETLPLPFLWWERMIR